MSYVPAEFEIANVCASDSPPPALYGTPLIVVTPDKSPLIITLSPLLPICIVFEASTLQL